MSKERGSNGALTDAANFSSKLLHGTIADLKDEYAEIPQEVKDVLPLAATLIARGALGGIMTGDEDRQLKQAIAIMKAVKVGGRIALNELMLEKAVNILNFGLGFVRKLIGI